MNELDSEMNDLRLSRTFTANHVLVELQEVHVDNVVYTRACFCDTKSSRNYPITILSLKNAIV